MEPTIQHPTHTRIHIYPYTPRVEHTITFAKIKKSVIHRSQLKPFGSVAEDKGTLVTGQEKPIEIRCYPPVVQAAINPEDESNLNADAILEQIQIAPRCKNCGMEGHTSLKCPKRKDIQVAPVKSDQPPEFTIFISDISDMTTEQDLQDLINTTTSQLFQQLIREEPTFNRERLPRIKSSMPRDYNGGYRGTAYVNITQTPLTEKLVPRLLEVLDGAKLGMVLIHAVLKTGDGGKKRGPNRYDDEEKYGHMAGRH